MKLILINEFIAGGIHSLFSGLVRKIERCRVQFYASEFFHSKTQIKLRNQKVIKQKNEGEISVAAGAISVSIAGNEKGLKRRSA